MSCSDGNAMRIQQHAHIEGMHPFDVGMLLDAHGIAVRTGHSCTQPLMNFFDIEGVVRASFSIYNTREEVEQLATSIARIIQQKTS